MGPECTSPLPRRWGEVGLSTLLPAGTEGEGESVRADKSGAATQLAVPPFPDPPKRVDLTSAARRSIQDRAARSCRHGQSGS